MEVSYPAIFRYLGQVIRIFLYARNIRRIRREYDYDVVVFNHSFHGLALSFSEPRPIIGMINDDNSCSKNLSNFSLSKDWLSYYAYGRLERWSIKRFRTILVNSVYLRKTLIKDYALPEPLSRKLKLFYKAIRLPEQPKPKTEFRGTIKVLFVKADFRRGGLEVLGEALGKLKGHQFRLTIIGPEDRFREQVLELVGHHDHVEVENLGFRPASFVETAMREHDIFCVPALHEALGVANLEALSRGISVVSSDAGGIPEIMDGGNNGWMAPAGDPLALSRCLSECIKDDSLREQKRLNGLQYSRRFEAALMYDRFRGELLESLT
jgi:glycosyltransferase involved in cell wall biosynthesis